MASSNSADEPSTPVSSESTEVVSPSRQNLALFGAEISDWVCERVELPADGTLRARFRSSLDADWIEITVLPLGVRGPVFRRLSHCQVRYVGQLATRTERRKQEVLGLVMGLAGAINGRLGAAPGASLAEALGRPRRAAPLLFGPKAVRELLGLDETSAQIAGFRLADVYPSSNVRTTVVRPLDIVLDFRRDEDERRALLVIGPKDDRVPAFVHTAHFSLSFLSAGFAEAPGVETLRAYIGFLLQVRDTPGMDVTFPASIEETFAAPALPEAPEPPQAPDDPTAVVNLAIGSDCGQKCAFCSVKETWPASDGGHEAYLSFVAELRDKRRNGVHKVRINGYDPLAFSRIVDVLRFAKEIGYTEASVFSPCTRLADEHFLDEVLAALPSRRRFFVPVYGAAAEVHDTVVGVPGAFEKVLQAIDLIVKKEGSRAVSLISVLVRKNLPHTSELLAFVRRRGLEFSMHLPYPSFESRADRYYTAAAKQSDVAAAVRDASGSPTDGRMLLLEGVAPCVTFRAMKDTGIDIAKWLRLPSEKPLLPGTEYRDPTYQHKDEGSAFQARSVVCTHAGRCALSTVCPGEVLRGYADLYGMDEFLPVSLADVLALGKPAKTASMPRQTQRFSPTLIDVPSTCDRACSFCHISKTPLSSRRPRGSDADVERALAELSGPVLFTGDDALSHPRIVEFIETARRRTDDVSLIGPPRKGVTAALAPRLSAAGLARYTTALFGPDAATHDAVAGKAGAFEAVCETALAMRSSGVLMELVTPLVRPVLPLLCATLERGRDIGATDKFPTLLVYAPDPVVKNAFDDQVPTWDALKAALSSLPPLVLSRVHIDGLPLCVLPPALRDRAAKTLDRSDPQLKQVFPPVCAACSRRAQCPGVANTVFAAVGERGLTALY
ncbi:MAG: hypothetical protein IPK82_38985 [Polyangiaceae bacterium]|nr:hypothetical protein [Polyangiaceae bacterium]